MDKLINPVSTYRIQFNKDFNLTDFEKIIPYLHKLGIRTIYASPIFEATPGSLHGYDGTDPNNINPEIGTEEQLLKISQNLSGKNIYWLQDIVPNHLSFDEKNKWLMDVLAKGEASEYSRFFDINWSHPDYPGRVMVPFPGSSLEKILKEKIPGEENYVLCSWQETDKQINYRRFFLVNSLICINIHYDDVFEKYHQLIKKLVAKNVFHGLRVDHVDGLYNPEKYLNDLRKIGGQKSYIVVEKILEPDENMPGNWPIQGTSGYDFLGMVNQLFTNRNSEDSLNALYFDLTGDSTPVDHQINEKKSFILHHYMGGELDNLLRLYKEAGLADSNVTYDELKSSIAAYLVSCPVYRYYGDDFAVMDRDKGKDMKKLRKFYTRCMQFTGPLMAKGVEDTLMYTYNKFIGHNEVGDSPEVFGYTVPEFHEMMDYRMKIWPYSINATSTHDTKRGEDVRARLNALTDVFEEWIELVQQWKKENEILKIKGCPDNNDEYFIYQTLAGSHPMISPAGTSREEQEKYPQRLAEYLQKSLREAKIHSNWTEPNTEYEEATINFTKKLIQKDAVFSKSFHPFLIKISDYGMINSLGQVVLKFTCPGIPDTYQGTELWDLSLVDPDNRRAVNYDTRKQMINDNRPLAELWGSRWSGQVKMKLLHQLLIARNRFTEIFTKGDYVPLMVKGEYRDNVIAFIRTYKQERMMVAVPLHFTTMHKYAGQSEVLPEVDWKDTKIILPPGENSKWEDMLNEDQLETAGEVSLNSVLRYFPVAVYKS